MDYVRLHLLHIPAWWRAGQVAFGVSVWHLTDTLLVTIRRVRRVMHLYLPHVCSMMACMASGCDMGQVQALHESYVCNDPHMLMVSGISAVLCCASTATHELVCEHARLPRTPRARHEGTCTGVVGCLGGMPAQQMPGTLCNAYFRNVTQPQTA